MTPQDCKFDFIKATVRAEHPEWSETRVFEQSIVQAKLGSFGRPTKEAGAVLVAQANGIKDPPPAPPKVVAATVPKSKGALVEGGFFNLLPGAEEEE
jgi:hypothetical protein